MKKYLDIIPLLDGYLIIENTGLVKYNNNTIEKKRHTLSNKINSIKFLRAYFYIYELITYNSKAIQDKIKVNIGVLFSFGIIFLILPSLLSIGVFYFIKNNFILNLAESIFRLILLIIFLKILNYDKTINNFILKESNIYEYNVINNHYSNWVDFLTLEVLLSFFLSIFLILIPINIRLIVRLCLLFLSIGVNFEIIYSRNKFITFLRKNIIHPFCKYFYKLYFKVNTKKKAIAYKEMINLFEGTYED